MNNTTDLIKLITDCIERKTTEPLVEALEVVNNWAMLDEEKDVLIDHLNVVIETIFDMD